MFHKSELGEHGEQFPHDTKGHVPLQQDCWRKMRFEHAGMDPDEVGISAEERARRIEYLDTQWWPKILESVREENERLALEHGDSFIKNWDRIVHQTSNPSNSSSVD